ncbi:MAG: hypothetical protein M3R07_10130, partial [Gemmatimonadota bacterium]|nr:hypothetical protein [Gemmatimonadota bacterium]
MRVVPTLLTFLAIFTAGACSSKDATSDPAKAADSTAVSTVPAAVEPTAVDISNYSLDMDKMRRYAGAIKGFSSLADA